MRIPIGKADDSTADPKTDGPTEQNTDNASASSDTEDIPLSLDVLQGHWVDVNGDTTLDFAVK